VIAETVVSQPQVQHQLSADTPIVLQKTSKVDQPPAKGVDPGLEADRIRLVAHDVIECEEIDRAALGSRPPSRGKAEEDTKLPRMLPLEICELLFILPARNDPSRLVFHAERRQARESDVFDATPTRNRFSLIRILEIPGFIDSL